MLDFKELTLEVLPSLRRFFINCDYQISNYSVGAVIYSFEYTKHIKYAISHNYLILMYVWNDDIIRFSYPVSEHPSEQDELLVLQELNHYCIGRTKLIFAGVPQNKVHLLVDFYNLSRNEIYHYRFLDQYIYDTQQFLKMKENAYSNVRYRIRLFLKQNLNYQFHEITENNISVVSSYIEDWWKKHADKIANDEAQHAVVVEPKYTKYFIELKSFVGAYMTINNQVVTLCVNEICGQTLNIHIEKIDYTYPGLDCFFLKTYIQYFYQKYHNKYFNRIDDAGIAGLRTAKLRLNPSKILNNCFFVPHTLFTNLHPVPTIPTKRLVLKDIDLDDRDYYDLCTNRMISETYEEDVVDEFYSTHHKNEPLTWSWLINRRKDLNQKEIEASWGIYLTDKLVGEVVAYNFTYDNTCEIGYRLLTNYQHKGYGFEAVKGLINYLFYELGIEKINAKCFKTNTPSKNLLLRLKMHLIKEDDKYFYFELTPKMI